MRDRLTHIRRSGVAAVLALTLTPWTTHAESAGTAGTDERVGRMTDMMMQMLPFGPVLDDLAAKNQAWPMQQKPDAVNAGQLACLRRELSAAGPRKTDLREGGAHPKADGTRLGRDMKPVDKRIAPVLCQIVNA